MLDELKNANNIKDKKICVLGLGYVGLTLAVAMADVGFEVLGIEIRPNVLELLQKGIPHFHEPGLEDKLKNSLDNGHFKFSNAIPDDWDGSVYIITIGTPLGADGKSRMDMIKNVVDDVALHLKANDIVIMRSTVRLGTTQNLVEPILNKRGVPFDLAFCPERTLEGKALIEIRTLPQIVGGLTLEAMIRASQIFQFLTPTVVRVSSVETAELIKLIDNSQRDVQFAYANEVARIADTIGVSAKEVIEAGKLGYPRTNLPMPGPVGGPCLEKDPYILAEGLAMYGVEPEITLTARFVNERLPRVTVNQLVAAYRELNNAISRPKITLLGLAFKGRPATDDLRGTMAKPIFAALQQSLPNAIFYGYDALVSRNQIEEFGLHPCDHLEEAFKESSLILILNNHPEFSSMPIQRLAQEMQKPGIIFDYWNNFVATDLEMPKNILYTALGSFKHDLLLHNGQ